MHLAVVPDGTEIGQPQWTKPSDVLYVVLIEASKWRELYVMVWVTLLKKTLPAQRPLSELSLTKMDG